MRGRRVVVTGVGTVNALGSTVRDFWTSCLAGESRVEPIPNAWRRYSEYNSSYWSPLPELDYLSLGTTKNEIRQSDPASLLADVAAREALEGSLAFPEIVDRKSNLHVLQGIESDRGGVFIGTGQGGVASLMANNSFQIQSRAKKQIESLTGVAGKGEFDPLTDLLEHMPHPLRMSYFSVGMSMPNSTAANLGIKYGLRGANETHAAACASGTIAIGKAFRAIRAGTVDFAISGGTEYLFDDYGGIFRGFDIPKALATSQESPERVNRPFDKNRSGFLFSQGGSGILILEALEHAQMRGAPILSELVGFSESFDAYNIMVPEPDGREIRTLVAGLLSETGVSAEAIDYINAHGTGTIKNDPIEAEAIRELFGTRPVVNSTKSLLGHTIGASGAIEAIVSTLSIRDQMVHTSRNIEEPIADLNFALRSAEHRIDNALSLSYAFGGHNGGLLFSRFHA